MGGWNDLPVQSAAEKNEVDMKKNPACTHTRIHTHMLLSTSKDNFLERYTRGMDMAVGSGWEAEYPRPWGYFVFCVSVCLGTLHQGQKTTEKNQGGGFPYTEYLLILQYIPSP